MICAVCRLPLTAGEALEVLDLATGSAWHVHRPAAGSGGRCFRVGAPGGQRFAIRLVDELAARDHDRRTLDLDPPDLT